MMNESSTWSGRDGIGWVRSLGWGEKKPGPSGRERRRSEASLGLIHQSNEEVTSFRGEWTRTVGTGQ